MPVWVEFCFLSGLLLETVLLKSYCFRCFNYESKFRGGFDCRGMVGVYVGVRIIPEHNAVYQTNMFYYLTMINVDWGR